MQILDILMKALIFMGTSVTQPGNMLDCRISSRQATYKLGQVPDIQVCISNKSRQEIYLPGALDGSEFRLRMPFVYFTVEHPQHQNAIPYEICKTTNPLLRDDFVKVGVGKCFNPYGDSSHPSFFRSIIIADPRTFNAVGKYRIRFFYITTADQLEAYTGISEHNPDSVYLKSLLTRVPKLALKSNTLEIEFVK